MALIKCKECGKEVSDKAKTCPNCGCPIFKEVVKKIKKKKWEELTYEEKMKILSYRKLQKNWWITERVVIGLCGIIGSIFLFISFFVEPTSNIFPHAHVIVVSLYSGCNPSFILYSPLL